jgi:putative transposase
MLATRKRNYWPWHAPPHFDAGEDLYLLTAACFEHRPHLNSEARRDEWVSALTRLVADAGGELRAWVVLPNHYHLLARVSLGAWGSRIARLHNGKATQWNREDGALGRKVWHRYADRRIRTDRHYFATLNYIHANPVRHGWTADAASWGWSSLSHYQREVGQATLAAWQNAYPIDRYGEGWDDQFVCP